MPRTISRAERSDRRRVPRVRFLLSEHSVPAVKTGARKTAQPSWTHMRTKKASRAARALAPPVPTMSRGGMSESTKADRTR
jgi:hypothetical protein